VTILSEIRERVRALFRRGRDEHELDEELRFHLEMQAEEYVRGGMRPDEARRRAAIEFGGVERVKEEVRHARGLGALESVARDVGYAWKSFRSGRSGLLLAAAWHLRRRSRIRRIAGYPPPRSSLTAWSQLPEETP